MTVHIASRNRIKLEEVQHFLPDARPLDIRLDEIQSTDPVAVVRHKLQQVRALRLPDPVIVEDTALCLAAWDGLPGALIKWFVDGLGPERLRQVAMADSETAAATAVSAVGVLHGDDDAVWCGSTSGRLVPARGSLGGWTPIFEVAGTGATLAEMSVEQRLRVTMRREPLQAAGAWLADRRRMAG